jgi:hypothetical protein
VPLLRQSGVFVRRTAAAPTWRVKGRAAATCLLRYADIWIGNIERSPGDSRTGRVEVQRDIARGRDSRPAPVEGGGIRSQTTPPRRCRARWRQPPQRPQDDVVGGFGSLHGGRKMADDCGEVVMGDTEAVVSLVEGATGVVVGAAEHLCHQEVRGIGYVLRSQR